MKLHAWLAFLIINFIVPFSALAWVQRAIAGTDSTARTFSHEPHNATVLITSQGLEPNQIAIAVGETVSWVHQTADVQCLVSDGLTRFYLLLVVVSSTHNASPASSAPHSTSQRVSAPTGWGAEIEPSEVYTHTFTETGHFPYHLPGSPDESGEVIVQFPTSIPPPRLSPHRR